MIALTALVVKTPAATQGASEKRMAKSSSPEVFIPEETAPARKPCGEVALPAAIVLKLEFMDEETIALFA